MKMSLKSFGLNLQWIFCDHWLWCSEVCHLDMEVRTYQVQRVPPRAGVAYVLFKWGCRKRVTQWKNTDISGFYSWGICWVLMLYPCMLSSLATVWWRDDRAECLPVHLFPSQEMWRLFHTCKELEKLEKGARKLIKTWTHENGVSTSNCPQRISSLIFPKDALKLQFQSDSLCLL